MFFCLKLLFLQVERQPLRFLNSIHTTIIRMESPITTYIPSSAIAIRALKTAAAAIIVVALMTGCRSSKSAQGTKPQIEKTEPGTSQKKEQQPQKYTGRARGATWGTIEYKDKPWVENVSRPIDITQGLYNRHISLWASHGRYYDHNKQRWKWQRPLMFGTCEDLFTQTIVVPYLMPMLENAGACVFSPRERDWQKNEIIVDNDNSKSPNYVEKNGSNRWTSSGTRGFKLHSGAYYDNENPFTAGSARMAKASKSGDSQISYQPRFPEEGSYAVYVSYPATGDNVDDACYTVYHKGRQTVFHVNQRMGAGTWVYLGTFEFNKGCNEYNRVVLTNESDSRGVVAADAVRFGGGMGNISRGGSRSGVPRCLEGARYYAQWAGAPYSVYSGYSGNDDYKDDINVRSYMTNWLGGGSCYMPGKSGLGVPIELSLAVHSDAGYSKDGQSLVGSLSICTTDASYGTLTSGISRQASKNFATLLLNNLNKDLTYKYGKWTIREVRDKNYSETRMPDVPSAIIETLSHQNFPDMLMAQDPNVRFTIARSIYKTILKFTAQCHNESYTVEPLQPKNFCLEFTGDGEVTLRWDATLDPQEPTARPTSYILYIATGESDFDNGTVFNSTSCKLKLYPDVLYSFKLTAANKGGESFPTETLCAIYREAATQSVLIVNGFNRLAPPAVINTPSMQGFDFNRDLGVAYGTTAGWSGRQQNYDRSKMGIEGEGGLGYSGTEWQGMFIAGNEFNYVREHASALLGMKDCNVVSCSRGALEAGMIDAKKYHCIDLILGLEKKDANSHVQYKTFTPALQRILRNYTRSGGALFVSGAYVASDMTGSDDATFLSQVLHLKYSAIDRTTANTLIKGMGTSFHIYRNVNEKHYGAASADVIMPTGDMAFSALTYTNGTSAAVAYKASDCRTFVIGFPFECIMDETMRSSIMKGIMNFLLK